MSEIVSDFKNSKKETTIMKNVLETMEKGGVTLKLESGEKVDFREIVKVTEYESFESEIKKLMASLADLYISKELTTPQVLVDATSNYETGKMFAEENYKTFETTQEYDRPGYLKTVFKMIMKNIDDGKIEKPEFLMISKEYVKDFDAWVSDKFDTTKVSKEDIAKLHYLYTISGEDLQNDHYRISYTHDTIQNTKSISYQIGYIGDTIIYPSTGKMIRHEYGGVGVNVPEYDPQFENILLRTWRFYRTSKYKQSIDATRAYCRYYYKHNLGIITMYGTVSLKENESVKLPFGKNDFVSMFEMSEGQQYWLCTLDGLLDTGVRCIVVPGSYSDKPASNNLDPFAFGRTDWLITQDKNFNIFKGRDYTSLSMMWIDPNDTDNYIIDPGEHLEEDGGLSGSSTANPNKTDEWLDAIQRGETWDEIAQNIENGDLPGFVISPDTGEVIGKPGMTIPEAEDNLNTNYPSHTTNPSALGLNVYTGRFSDVKSVIQELWKGDFIDKIAKLLTSPLEAVVGVLTIPALPNVGGKDKVQIGNYTTNVSMSLVNSQFKTVNIGMFNIEPLYADSDCAYLDYEQTRVFLYVPYCGMTELPVSSIMDTAISISLTIDVMTGLCCANIYSDGKFISSMDGDCSYKYPLSGVNYSGNYGVSLGGILSAAKDFTVGSGTTIVGNISGSPSGYVNNKCVVIIHRPVPYYEQDNSVNDTFATLRRGTLSNFSGFVVCSKFYQPSGDFGYATKEELSEIENLLKQGVYL